MAPHLRGYGWIPCAFFPPVPCAQINPTLFFDFLLPGIVLNAAWSIKKSERRMSHSRLPGKGWGDRPPLSPPPFPLSSPSFPSPPLRALRSQLLRPSGVHHHAGRGGHAVHLRGHLCIGRLLLTTLRPRASTRRCLRAGRNPVCERFGARLMGSLFSGLTGIRARI